MKNRRQNLLKDRFYRELLDNLYDGVYFTDIKRRILYWNDAAEKMTGYKREEIAGSYCWDNILRHVDDKGVNLCEGRCPLDRAMKDDRTVEEEVFFHHRDGHRVPVFVRVSPVHNTRGKVVGAVEVFNNNLPKTELTRKVRELERMALLDPLTKVGNRRYGEMNLAGKLREFKRYGWPFGVLFIDIDHFKTVNDTYGHDAGDQVLRVVAATIMNGLRSSDVVSRWGGEEFVAFVANVNEEKLLRVAQKIRRLVENSSIPMNDRDSYVTVSIGATLARKRDTAAGLVKRADSLMYRSKKEGRNRVSI